MTHIDFPLEAYWRFGFDWTCEVEMQEIVFVLDLIPGWFDEFCLVVHELEVEREGTVELYMEGNCFTFYYFVYDVFVWGQSWFELLHFVFKCCYMSCLHFQKNFKAGVRSMLFFEFWLRKFCPAFFAFNNNILTLFFVLLYFLLEKLFAATLALYLLKLKEEYFCKCTAGCVSDIHHRE